MEITAIKSLNKSQLLDLFNKKDSIDKNKNRELFSDVFYDFSEWPINSLRDFWLIRRVNRLRLTNFSFGNGLSLKMLLEMLTFYHIKCDNNFRRFNEISDIWKRIQENLPAHYYYFNLQLGLEMFFDGRKRKDGKPAELIRINEKYAPQFENNYSTYCKPHVYANLVKRRVLEAEIQRYKSRKLLILEIERQKKFKKALEFLKLNSVDELFS